MKDGWFCTGDIARVDADGYYLLDRKKDLIIRGGYNVYPREVEEALQEHSAVAQAVVIGMPHDSLGEEVGAAVVLKSGVSADAEELRQFVKDRVAGYKYPRRIWLVDSLPNRSDRKGAAPRSQTTASRGDLTLWPRVSMARLFGTSLGPHAMRDGERSALL